MDVEEKLTGRNNDIFFFIDKIYKKFYKNSNCQSEKEMFKYMP
jgi:hypothetical protein